MKIFVRLCENPLWNFVVKKKNEYFLQKEYLFYTSPPAPKGGLQSFFINDARITNPRERKVY